jgi:hypothetical protein
VRPSGQEGRSPVGAPLRRLVGAGAALFVDGAKGHSSVSEPVAAGHIARGRTPGAARARGLARTAPAGRRTADAGSPAGLPSSAPGHDRRISGNRFPACSALRTPPEGAPREQGRGLSRIYSYKCQGICSGPLSPTCGLRQLIEPSLLLRRFDFAIAIVIADVLIEKPAFRECGTEIRDHSGRHLLVNVDPPGNEGDRQLGAGGVIGPCANCSRRHVRQPPLPGASSARRSLRVRKLDPRIARMRFRIL